MAKLFDIRQGLVRALQTVPGLTAKPYPLDAINDAPPVAFIQPVSNTYHSALAGGSPEWVFTVRLYACKYDIPGAWGKLDLLIDAEGQQSVQQALESDPTLGGVVDSLTVTHVDQYGAYTIGNLSYLGARLTVEIYA